MTISRVNAPGWGVGDPLTSAQQNGVDLNTTFALDKRAAQTDTLASIVSCGGSGRIVDTYAVGADAATTYLLSGANSLINASAITAARTYRLSNTGALAGDRLMILNPSNFALTVTDDTPTTIAVLGPTVQGGNDSTWADFIFTGTAWIVWRSSKPSALAATTFTANGTYVVPRGVTQLLLIGWGGGAGGGGGGSGSTTGSGPCATGGGGGGATQQLTALVVSSAGTSIPVTIGASGAGGSSDTDGTVGGDTTFGSLATMVGASSGIAGGVNSVLVAALGGGSTRLLSNAVSNTRTLLDTQGVVQRAPGSGGPGRNDPGNVGFTGLAGTGSAQGFAGGNGAAKGTTNGVANGGGGGGGGGGGPAGVGGNAGAGGAGGNSGSGAAGVNGTASAANSGAGGGGGGGGGQCTFGGASVPGGGGSGGAGGSGQLIVIPLR